MFIRKAFDAADVVFDSNKVDFDGLYEVVGQVTGSGPRRKKKKLVYKDFFLTYNVIGKTKVKIGKKVVIYSNLARELKKKLKSSGFVSSSFTEVHNSFGLLKTPTSSKFLLWGKVDVPYINQLTINGNTRVLQDRQYICLSKTGRLKKDSFHIIAKTSNRIDSSSNIKGNLRNRLDSTILIKGEHDVSPLLYLLDII
jgi:hypothetical protein